MTTTGEKLTLLAEIIRVSTKGATEAEISNELSLSSGQAITYIRFLKSKKLLIQVDGNDFFPSHKGLAYLSTYDEAADLVDIDEPAAYFSGSRASGVHKTLSWDKTEIAARMREIIER
jgi:hypothetical protein